MASTAFTSALWFLVVIATIPLALWLFKRSPAGAKFSGGGTLAGTPRQVGALALSANQRVVTVEVGQGESRRWLVLGVTPQQISTLHTLVPAELPDSALAAAPTPLPGFAQLLGRLRQDKGSAA